MATLPADPAGVPVRFGPQGELAGVMHAPRGATPRRAVLICPPLGREAIWAHRTLRQLALQLARRGAAALRFDPYGTGDSGGDESDWSLARWQEDATNALRVLVRQAPRVGLTVVGLRFGTVLAASVADRCDDVESLVAWHPVVLGADHLDDLRAVRRARLRSFPVPVPRAVRRDDSWIVGFRLNQGFVQDVSAYDVRSAERMHLTSALLLEEETARTSGLADHLRSAGVEVAVEPADDLVAWTDPIDRVVVPYRTVERIVSWVERPDEPAATG